MAQEFSRLAKRWVWASVLVASLLLVVANSASWANRNIFETEKFTTTAVTALTSQSSRDALANEVVSQALADYPRLKSFVEDRASSFISGLLDSNVVERILTKSVSRLQVFMTSPKKEPVVINLAGVKDTVQRLITAAGREDEARIDPAQIPDQIVLLQPESIPNAYSIGVTLGWLAPLLLIVAVGLLAWPYVRYAPAYRWLLVRQGATLILFGLLALAIGPIFRPVVIQNVTNDNLRIVVGNLYDSFIATFDHQTAWLIWAGVLMLLVVAGISGYSYYRTKRVAT